MAGSLGVDEKNKSRSGFINLNSIGLFLDYYELTMAKADLDHKNLNTITENYYVRKIPQGAYLVSAGLEQVIHFIENFKIAKEDIEWLSSTSGKDFDAKFCKYLQDFKFDGDVYAAPEGTVVFPNEPIINITGRSLDIQLFETYILNVMNYQTLIATKASRVVRSAKGKDVIDFGARRAHGRDAAILGARAAFISGVTGTSLVLAGKIWGIPYIGTMGHKFVQDRKNELDAFREYAESFPHNSILLVDTYDTLKGARNACVIGKELRENGFELKGVRLDSGNLLDLSKKVRKILDEEGLTQTKIFASSDLDEFVIEKLLKENAPIDGFGVGTRLITGANYNSITHEGNVSALNGIYKIVERIEGDTVIPKMKITDDLSKATLPGRKQVYRRSESGKFIEDTITIWDEKPDSKHDWHPLLIPIIKNGKIISNFPSLREIKAYAADQIRMLPDGVKKNNGAQEYPVKLSNQINELIDNILRKSDKDNSQ
ncbi:MAG: nicotinate phosphoribosyltransferase [Candidatus Bathyarchaeia archaeon]